MIVNDFKIEEIGNLSIAKQIRAEIHSALQAIQTTKNGFEVNDSEWFWINPKGAVRPTVVNSAKFLTGRFQGCLNTSYGWTVEKTILGQTFDAYKVFTGSFDRFVLLDKNYLSFLTQYEVGLNVPIGSVATDIYQRYCGNGSPKLGNDMLHLNSLFQKKKLKLDLRVGVEFETGNIASSFRALNKLSFLYRSGEIDLGVFVTSFDKANCAARIWPISNRNGSLQELEKRCHDENIDFPLWQFGFQPDSFSSSAKYLGADCKVYSTTPTNNKKIIGGVEYEEHQTPEGKMIYRKSP